jgi:hypothetical protein
MFHFAWPGLDGERSINGCCQTAIICINLLSASNLQTSFRDCTEAAAHIMAGKGPSTCWQFKIPYHEQLWQLAVRVAHM